MAGTKKHAYAKKLVDRYQKVYGDRGLRTETSWIDGEFVSYGKKGSTRIDIYDDLTKQAYDYKFTINPGKGLSQNQVNRIMRHGPGINSVREINP